MLRRYASTSRAILSVIVTGISLIFIGFTVGWIYSCYVINRTPEQMPEIDANGQPSHGNVQGRNERSFLLTVVGRYLNFNGFDYNQPDRSSPIFAISQLNDKPPPYASLFVCDRTCSTSGCESLSEVVTSKSNLSSNWIHGPTTTNSSDVHFTGQELPPPAYTTAVRLCDYRN
jgi:hypothetical protein